ncbi:MAG: DHA2 family efflux MFS transporter permease subunit [Gammaproteobacteria bacterium]|nr:DHA2 family efflux MFS transporter permease subunit [Gammaproteobacteria bacterium]
MTQPQGPAETGSHDTRRSRLTLGIAGLAAMVTYLDTTILFVAFPDITSSFGESPPSSLSWVLNAYTIIFAALLVPAGKLADRLGHRRAFLVGSFTFTVASMACGLAPSVESLVAARILQGTGAAILVPASLALVIAAFSREKLPRVVAIWGAIGAFSAALGPSLGALVVDGFGWRWAFFLNLPFGIITLVAGVRYLRESRDPAVPIPSVLGVVLIALAAGSLAYGVVESDAVGWGSAQTVVMLGVGLLLLGAFVAHQRWTKSPTLDLELFALANFRWGNLAMFSFSLAFSAMFFGLILFLVNVWGWSIIEAGLAVTPGPLLAAFLAPRFGKLAGQIGQRPLIIAGGLAFAASALYRMAILTTEVNYVMGIAIPLAVDAVAIALVFPQVTSVAVQALPANRTGVGGAVTQAVRQFGGSFGVALTIALIGSTTATMHLGAGFEHLWWLLVAAGLATAAFALPLRPRTS